MFGAIPTQFVTGERYQIVGPAPTQGSLVTVGEAQLELNSLWPGASKVVAAGLAAGGASQAVIVFDWIGSSQAVPSLSSSATLTDLGPSSANAGPTVPIQAPAAASSTSTGTYVAIGLGVAALGALAWYAATRSARGRTYAYEGARDNPLPSRVSAGERAHPTGHETFASYKAAVRRYLETRNMATRRQAALIVDSLEDVIGRYWREGMPVASAAARLPALG